MEMIICIKLDLSLNNLQKLISHKTQPTNQPTNQPTKQTNQTSSMVYSVRMISLLAIDSF